MKKPLKAVIWAASVLFVLINAAGFVAGYFLVELALNPRSDKSTVMEAEHNAVDIDDAVVQSWEQSVQWLDSAGYEDLFLQSHDDLRLHSYLLENQDPGGTWVVLNHGYISSGRQMAGNAEIFYGMGYNVLLPDARACGQSEGCFLGMGWFDRLDLLAWAEEINRRYAPDNIVLYGVSMGGAAVMMASGEPMPENVRAVVEDCGYTSAYEEFGYQLGQLFGLPSFPVMNYSSAVTRMRAGYWLGEASALQQVQKSVTPTLFIHGEDDTFVPCEMVNRLYDACSAEKQLLVIPGAGHGGAATTDAALYWSTVTQFLDKYLE